MPFFQWNRYWGALPLIRYLEDAHPHANQPWYADDAGAGGGGESGWILAYFWDQQDRGPLQGYFPEPTKHILVVAPRNVERGELFFRGMGIKVVTGSLYPRGLVGDRESKDIWLAEKVQGWAESEKKLSGVSHKHPQYANSGLQKPVQ